MVGLVYSGLLMWAVLGLIKSLIKKAGLRWLALQALSLRCYEKKKCEDGEEARSKGEKGVGVYH
jgi:hypothetical protein